MWHPISEKQMENTFCLRNIYITKTALLGKEKSLQINMYYIYFFYQSKLKALLSPTERF